MQDFCTFTLLISDKILVDELRKKAAFKVAKRPAAKETH